MKKLLLSICLLSLTSCYTLKNHTIKDPLYCAIFENKTNIYGLENEFALYLPIALRKEYIYLTSSNQKKSKYKIKGIIEKYRKKTIRRDSNGIPTHQQVEITITYQILSDNKKDKKIIKKINNIDYRLNSGYYSITNNESESTARIKALKDLAGLIATETSIYFSGE
ncbi:MAG: hypothetical protein COA79_10645 [Planctomycetota bacterium]|nr:MAG: hypothetical protein COA79_10645 [Planctomycetota bacterium]